MLASALLSMWALWANPGTAEAQPTDEPAADSSVSVEDSTDTLDTTDTTDTTESVDVPCAEQDPQAFLVSGTHSRAPDLTEEERRAQRHDRSDALEYRTEQYGYFEGFGEAEWNEHTPMENSERTRFMGRSVRLNERVIEALHCVETVILTECADFPYEPESLSGLREVNTYHGGGVSNHVYGIAIDIDASLNTCCGCMGEWADHPLCLAEVESVYERMAMPECWVHVFERYGFYWLGHNEQLQDTMHFEFMGDPDLILPTETED